jgi:hypothetical protein
MDENYQRIDLFFENFINTFWDLDDVVKQVGGDVVKQVGGGMEHVVTQKIGRRRRRGGKRQRERMERMRRITN